MPTFIRQDTLPTVQSDTLKIEMTRIVQLWQSSRVRPQSIFLRLLPEGATFARARLLLDPLAVGWTSCSSPRGSGSRFSAPSPSRIRKCAEPCCSSRLASVPGAAAAQSSQFGVRGLGLPGRSLSTYAFATGGAFGMFDPTSGLNPAALGRLTALTAGVRAPCRTSGTSRIPAGTESLRETRFPLRVGGRGRSGNIPRVVGISFSSYTSRDFTLATADTIVLRGRASCP